MGPGPSTPQRRYVARLTDPDDRLTFLAGFGGQMGLPKMYMRTMPSMRQSQVLIGEIAELIVAGTAGSVETLDLNWEDVSGSRIRRM